MATVTTQANATRQSANQLGIPPSHNSTLQQPGPGLPLILLLFRRAQTWLTLKMANKRRKNRGNEKYFWRLAAPTRIEVMSEGPTGQRPPPTTF
jgi:hypothetical protein